MTRALSDALFRFATVLGVPVAHVDGLVGPVDCIVDRVDLTMGHGWRRRVSGRAVDRLILPGRGSVYLLVWDHATTPETPGTGWARKPLCAGTPSEMAAHLDHLSLVACHLNHLRTCTAADIRVLE